MTTKMRFPRGPHAGCANLGAFIGRERSGEFDLYGEAFRRAGQRLVTSFAEDRCYADHDALPAVYVYRHATELYLKAVVRSGQQLFLMYDDPLAVQDSVLVRHELRPLLAPVQVIFKELGWSQDYRELVPYVEAIDEYDPQSFAFRYPVDKRDENLLPSRFVFNVLAFAEDAEDALAALSGAVYGIDDHIEHWIDNAAEARDFWS